MKLYYSSGACSLGPHISLKEAGLPFDAVRVDLGSHKNEGGDDFYAINPKGYVPALQLDDGSILTENAAIAQYVADKAPEKKLAPPAGTMERYRLQEWIHFIATEIHKAFSPLFNPACTAETRQAQLARISGRLDLVQKSLDGKQYLLGDQFTVADAYFFAVLNWSHMMGPDLKKWPAVEAYYERMLARPAVRAAMAAEGLGK
jgi:glutathione S-transferase